MSMSVIDLYYLLYLCCVENSKQQTYYDVIYSQIITSRILFMVDMHKIKCEYWFENSNLLQTSRFEAQGQSRWYSDKSTTFVGNVLLKIEFGCTVYK